MKPIIAQLDKFFQQIYSLLEKECEIVSKRSKYSGAKLEVKTGLIQLDSGLLIPSKVVAHRVLYETYEHMFLKTFLGLAKAAVKHKTERFLPFAYRTIFELGVKRADVLFSNGTSAADKKRLKLLSMLVDYGSLSEAKYHKQFKELYTEEKDCLTATEKKLFDQVVNLKGADSVLTKKMRQEYTRYLSTLQQKVTPIDFGNHNAEIAIYSGYSHMLHGNLLFIQDAVDREISWRNEFWIYGILIHAGQNLAARVAEYLGDTALQSEIDTLRAELKEFWPKLGAAWEVAIKNQERRNGN